jgi:YcaO-like protein with predicted kinase domain
VVLSVDSSGTACWRSRDVEAVAGLLVDHSSDYGIVRIADITGLDLTGIPVYIGIRPDAMTLSVSAGKGINKIDSFVSAGMEAVETAVAERMKPSEIINACTSDLGNKVMMDLSKLTQYSTSSFTDSSVVSWCEARRLLDGKEVYVPANMVSLNKRLIVEGIDIFPWSSNGLASGLSESDAVLSGMYELIERDAWTCWEYYSRVKRVPITSVEEESIPYESTMKLINSLRREGLNIIINPLRTELDIPVFRALLVNDVDMSSMGVSLGFGCHHSTEVALNRAVTEAVQARTVYISGARDDIVMKGVTWSSDISATEIKARYFPDKIEDSVFDFQDSEEAVRDLCQRFKEMKWEVPCIYRYSDCGPFKVVRVISESLAPSSARHGLPYCKQTRVGLFQPRLSGIQEVFKGLGEGINREHE